MIYVPESASPTRSVDAELPPRELLFGEIDMTGTRSLHSAVSRCNLTLSSSSTFLRFWLLDETRNALLEYLDVDDKARMRLVCHDFSNRVAPHLFGHLHITFRAASFTRPARVAALDRIGHVVHTCTFSFAHTDETALPPLIDPTTGEELTFVYTPQVKAPASTNLNQNIKHPKFGSWEVASLLVKQYPPVFHAATNVPSFVKVFSALPNLRHLQVSCPSAPTARHPPKGNVVDYALISLRIAVERAPLRRLDTLSFLPIHPQGLFYLQPLMGFANSPRSARRWSQITAMTVHMQSFASDTTGIRREHLRTLHTYLRNFVSSIRVFNFRWQGTKGPSPLSLESEPCFTHSSDAPATDPDAKTPNYTLRALRFTALNHMQLENAVMDAAQVSAFICGHKKTLEEFKFEQVRLRTGDWDEALSPLSRISGNDLWKAKAAQHGRSTHEPDDESMDVPIMLSPANLEAEELIDISQPPAPPPKDVRFAAGTRGDSSSLGGFGSWLAKAKSGGRALRAREHLHALRHSVLTWR